MKKIIYTILLIIWLIIIFYLSNQTGSISSSESTKLVSYVLVDQEIINILHNPLREAMHFVEYFILGFLLYNTLTLYKVKKAFIYSIIFSFIYIISDEIHQIFIPGRAFEMLDIILDSLGSFIAIIITKRIKVH